MSAPWPDPSPAVGGGAYEVSYRLGSLQLAQRTSTYRAALDLAESLARRGCMVEIRDPGGDKHSLEVFRVAPPEPRFDPTPEEILAAVRGG